MDINKFCFHTFMLCMLCYKYADTCKSIKYLLTLSIQKKWEIKEMFYKIMEKDMSTDSVCMSNIFPIRFKYRNKQTNNKTKKKITHETLFVCALAKINKSINNIWYMMKKHILHMFIRYSIKKREMCVLGVRLYLLYHCATWNIHSPLVFIYVLASTLLLFSILYLLCITSMCLTILFVRTK